MQAAYIVNIPTEVCEFLVNSLKSHDAQSVGNLRCVVMGEWKVREERDVFVCEGGLYKGKKLRLRSQPSLVFLAFYLYGFCLLLSGCERAKVTQNLSL